MGHIEESPDGTKTYYKNGKKEKVVLSNGDVIECYDGVEEEEEEEEEVEISEEVLEQELRKIRERRGTKERRDL